mgnify:CR=1 FL=1
MSDKQTKPDLSGMSVEEKRAMLRKMLASRSGSPAAPKNAEPDDQRLADKVAELPDEYVNLEQMPELVTYHNQYRMFEQQNLQDPFFKVNETITRDVTTVEGRELVSYASYNYLGYSGDSRVSDAAAEAIRRYGTSVSASRMVSGEKPLHKALEREISELLGTEDALVLVSGHATNVTVIGHLYGPDDLIVFDSLSHNSIQQGAALSGARCIPFPHNNTEALENVLKKNRLQYRKVLIAIEGVYSVDGDIPDLHTFIELKKKYRTNLMVDEAHSLGVLGESGRGIREHFGVDAADVDIWMGTLSKTLASCGGYIGGAADLIHYLRCTVPGFMFSVGISPANAAASLEVLRLMKSEQERVTRLQSNAAFFLERAKASGLDTGLSKGSAVIPVITGDSMKAVRLTNKLFECDVNVSPILFPAVAEEGARLRFFITSEHTEDQMADTLDKTRQIMNELEAM